MFNLSPRYFDKISTAFIINRFSSDTSQYDAEFSVSVFHVAQQIVIVITQIILMAMASLYTLIVIVRLLSYLYTMAVSQAWTGSCSWNG